MLAGGAAPAASPVSATSVDMPGEPASMDTLAFLRKIWPAQGYYIIARLIDGKWRHTVCESMNEAAAYALEYDSQGVPTYFALAAYKECRVEREKNGQKYYSVRLQANTRALRAFWFDLDVDPVNEKKFTSQEAAVDALISFCADTNLPTPMVISSGFGVHCYFVLTDEISPDQWKQTATALKALCTHYKFKADPACTSDPARVLRPVGTWNRKDPASPRPVERIADAPESSYVDFHEKVLIALTLIGINPPKPRISGNTESFKANDAFSVQKNFPPSYAYLIADRCQQLRLMRDKHGCIDEPLWYILIQLLRNTVEGEEIIHAWSSGHQTYSSGETDGKIAQVKDMGPPYCATVEGRNPGGCDGCAFRGKVISPIQLGTNVEAVMTSDSNTSAANITTTEDDPHTKEVAEEAVPNEAVEQSNTTAVDLPLTDLGNARRFVRDHGDRVRYVHEYKRWLLWDGQRWVFDEDGAVSRMGKETALKITDAARTALYHDAAKALVQHAKNSQSEARLAAMTKLAQTEQPIALTQAMLDNSPMLLGVANGVIDMSTGEFRAPRKEDYFTKASRAPFLPTAACPQWIKFLRRVMDGDEETIAFLQRAAGYSLTARTDEQCLFFLYGHGANGKTTYLNTMRALLGDYAATAESSSFMARKDGSPTNDLARLRGKRFIATSEVENGQRFAEASIKAMTGGEAIVARFLYGEFFEFTPTFKIWLAANHKPTIRGDDHAIWRRILLVPFTVQIPKAERDPSLGAKLHIELSGILNWAIRGCLEWQRQGLRPPERVRAAVKSYQDEMDVIGQWITDRCETGADLKVKAGNLFADYRVWTTMNKHFTVNQREFKQRLIERGFTALPRTNQGYFYQGLRLTSDMP